MPINLSELMDRLVALEVEAMAALTPTVVADAKPYFFHMQEETPYFTNRLGAFTVESNSDEIDVYQYDIIVRLVVGHVTEGFDGKPERLLKLYLPQLVNYINRRELLKSASYAAALDHLTWARVTGGTGYRAFTNDGIGVIQAGVEITVTCDFDEQIDQVYA